MKKYNKYFAKKISLLFCSTLIIFTFINAKASISEEKEKKSEVAVVAMSDKVCTLYSNNYVCGKEYVEIDKNILIQQNIESFYENNITVVPEVKKEERTTIGGLVIKKRDKIRISKKERDVLYRIVEAEAGGENMSGKMLVANVVINRYLHKSFPNTIKDVVFAHSNNTYQFSPVRDGRYYTVKVSKHTKEAVDNALSGMDNSKGALYFMCRNRANSKNVTWFDNSLDYVLKYGCHEFFK